MTASQFGPPTVITWERIGVPEPRVQDVHLHVHAAGVEVEEAW